MEPQVSENLERLLEEQARSEAFTLNEEQQGVK